MVRVQSGGAVPPRPKLPHGRCAAVTTDIDANWKAVIETLLANEACQFIWPLAFADEPEPGLEVMRQIVPRSFSRTRIVGLIFDAKTRWTTSPTAGAAPSRARLPRRAAKLSALRGPSTRLRRARPSQVAAACAE